MDELEEKNKAFEKAIQDIKKEYNESVFRLGDNPIQVERISSGCLSLDVIIGGGWPRGRIVEMFGSPGGGKTTQTLLTIAEVQRQKGRAVFVDVEHAFEPSWATQQGVDVDNLWISQPDSGEGALNAVEKLVNSNAVDLIVVDSVAALLPGAELEADIGEQQMALQARLMSQALRKLTAATSKSKTVLIFINQLRETMQIGYGMGPKKETPGGRALKFYSSLRVDVSLYQKLKDKEGNVIGHNILCKIVKNKVAPPFKEITFPLFYATGFDKGWDLLSAGLYTGVLKMSGPTLTFEDQKWVGKDGFLKAVKEDNTLYEKVKEVIQRSAFPKHNVNL